MKPLGCGKLHRGLRKKGYMNHLCKMRILLWRMVSVSQYFFKEVSERVLASRMYAAVASRAGRIRQFARLNFMIVWLLNVQQRGCKITPFL
jgi:hypothetical protein